jgi:predicted transcriptional regulator
MKLSIENLSAKLAEIEKLPVAEQLAQLEEIITELEAQLL